MQLNIAQSYRLLDSHRCFVREVCDKCGQLLGPVRFTRRSDSGVWCSRECRDGADAHAPGTCQTCGASLAGLRRGAKFCSDVCRMRLSRKNGKSQTRQIIPNEQLKTQDLQSPVEVLAIPSHSGAVGT
jgi:hypothetical protein